MESQSNLIAELGFILVDGKIKCSKCSFRCMDTDVASIFELVKQHLESIKNTEQIISIYLKNR